MIEGAIIILIKGLILTTFLLIIASPAYFFKKVDEYLEEKEVSEYIKNKQNTLIMITSYDELLDDELRRIQVFDNICNKNLVPEAKRIWENKRSEYIRYINWRKIKESSGATEKAPS